MGANVVTGTPLGRLLKLDLLNSQLLDFFVVVLAV